MKENLVIRNGQHYDLRVNGEWHDHQTLREAHGRLSCAGLDSHEMLASAISVPKPFEIEYRPSGRHRWWFNGHPVPVKCVRFELSEAGCDKESIEGIIRGHKRAYEIEQMAKCSQVEQSTKVCLIETSNVGCQCVFAQGEYL